MPLPNGPNRNGAPIGFALGESKISDLVDRFMRAGLSTNLGSTLSWHSSRGMMIETKATSHWNEPVTWIRISQWPGKLGASRILLEPIPNYATDLRVGESRTAVMKELKRLSHPSVSQNQVSWTFAATPKGKPVIFDLTFDKTSKHKSLEWMVKATATAL